MKYTIILFVLVLFSDNIYAQKKQKDDLATNIEYKETTVNDEPALLITFDLNQAKDVPYYNVTIEAIVNGQKVKVDNVDGDIGEYIKKGTNKKVTWKITRDVPSDDFTVEKIIVEAYPVGGESSKSATKPDLPKPSIGLTAGVGSIAASGLGLVILGLTQEGKASDDYEDYKNNRDPNSEFYQENSITRDELYDQANKKHKTAQILMAGGGAVVLGAGAMLVSRLIQRSKLSARNDFNLTPYMVVNSSNQNKSTNGFGLKLSRKF